MVNVAWSFRFVDDQLKVEPPPVKKIESLIDDIRLRILMLIQSYNDLSEDALEVWLNKDIRFTLTNGRPILTKSRKGGAKKGRRDLYEITTPAEAEAWQFHRQLLHVCDGVGMLLDMMELTLKAYRGHYRLPFPRKKRIYRQYEELTEKIKTIKDLLSEWKSNRYMPEKWPDWIWSIERFLGEPIPSFDVEFDDS